MRFPIGARVGAFEILSHIGAGGMGEVYGARDTRLDRTVALKFLSPEAAGAAPEALERFRQEARAISRLTHPNICTLYDIGEHDGGTFLVMERIQGETLADRLARAPLTVAEVLRYGSHVADALDAAHSHGVVHRDLKPGNIILAREGAKLLDFGIAALRTGAADTAASVLTASAPLRTRGVVLGTLPYMAPEALEGRAADARADLFALGVVLYEMTTGIRPFRGDTDVSLMAAILREEPEPITARQPSAPASLERLIRRCLAKDPDDRWQTARDLAAELRWIEQARTANVPAVTAAGTRRWIRGAPLLAAVGGAAVAAATAVALRPAPSNAAYTPVTFRSGAVSGARFTADGRNVVYSASWEGGPSEVFLGQESTPDARPLGLADGRLLSLSSGGHLAVLFGRQTMTETYGSQTLARAPLAGGTRRDLLEGVKDADWLPGTDELALVRSVNGASVVEFPAGTKVYEAPAVWSLRVSPDGRRVVFFEGPVRFGSMPNARVVVVDRSGTTSTLTAGWAGFGLAWTPSGSEVWFTGTRGNAAPAVHGVSLSGEVRTIEAAPDWLVLHDISPQGRVLVARNSIRAAITCQTPGSEMERDLTWFGGSAVRDLSPDGRMLIFNETLHGSVSGIPSVFRRNLDGSPAVRLGMGDAQSLSPDGKWLLTLLRDEWLLLPTGAGTARTLPTGTLLERQHGTWLPDGARVAFTASERGRPGSRRIYVQDVAGGAPRPVSPEGVALAARAPTPDGIRVLGRSSTGWSWYDLDGGSSRPVSTLGPSDEPIQWSADGRTLYVLSSRMPEQWAARDIVRIDMETGARTPWKTLSPADPVGVDYVTRVVVTPDARSYCYSYTRRLGALFIVDGLK